MHENMAVTRRWGRAPMDREAAAIEGMAGVSHLEFRITCIARVLEGGSQLLGRSTASTTRCF